MPRLATLIVLIRLLIDDRQQLVLENAALRHQLAVLKRSVKRPKIHDSYRVFWILMKRMLADWRDAVHFVKLDTIARRHRKASAGVPMPKSVVAQVSFLSSTDGGRDAGCQSARSRSLDSG
jgi:hypothetical protein